MMKNLIAFVSVSLAVAAPAALVADDPKKDKGDFSLPSVSPLNAAQLAALRELVEKDPEAETLAEKVRSEALPLIGANPQPLEVIQYEGLVNTDPRRIATVEKLSAMADVARLMRYWQVSADPEAASTLRDFIVAWTRTYRITGNDVNENKFYPLLVAYHGLRDEFPRDSRAAVDRWVEQLGAAHADAVAKSRHFTNRYSKHVRLTAIAGMILDRPEWIEAAHEGIKRFVSESLRENGSSYDFEHRDTLTYHSSALRPPIELAMLAGEEGDGLYRWTSEDRGSLEKSVDFVVPYALGEKTHEEWRNSRVALDRRRAEAGLEKYRRGRLFDPQDALELMEEASYFDRDLIAVVRQLTASDAQRFPTWQTLVNEAARARD